MGTTPAIRIPPAERIDLPARREALAPGREFVRAALERQGWGGEPIEAVALAVSEALTNAVEHGSRPGAPVAVEVRASETRARIRIADGGRPGSTTPSPLRAAPPPSSDHGRGLIIMGALADALEVRRAGRGTEVVLTFTRPGARATTRAA